MSGQLAQGCAALVALLTLAPAAPAFAEAPAPRGLLGAWQADKIERKGRVEPFPQGIELRTELQDKGRLVSTLRHEHGTKRRVGTWKVVGRRLQSSLEGRSEEVVFRLAGDTLILTNPKTGERLYLRRAR